MFTRDFEVLLAFRFVQGSGAAALGSLNLTLLGDLFDGKQRTQAMGYNASVLSIATASYPFLGGVLATAAWYMPFVLTLTAIPVGLIVLFFLKNPEPAATQSLGAYLRSALKSLQNRYALLLFGASLMVFILLYGAYLTYFGVLLADRFEASPFLIGVVMAFMSITTAITSSQAGRIARHFSEHVLLTLSFLFYGISLALIPLMPNLWLMLPALAFYGIGMGINMPAIQSLLASCAPLQYRGAFMSMNGMVLRLGQTLGPLLMGVIFIFGGVEFPFFAGAVLAGLTALVLFVHRKFSC